MEMMSDPVSPLIPLVGLLSCISLCGLVGAIVNAAKGEPEAPVIPEPDRLVCGRQRNLVARQRAAAWAKDIPATPQQSAAATATVTTADETFSQWFKACLRFPDSPTPNDVVPMDHWIQSYIQYCDSNNGQRINVVAELNALMTARASINHCIVGEKGELINAQLIG
jgi:hypothetical protein